MSDRQARWAIVLAAAIAYGCACAGTFVYDDLHSVRDNPHLRTLANVPDFFVDPGMFSTSSRMYRPVLLTTFALDHAVAGVEAWVFKLTNLLLHVATAIALFGVARTMRATTVAAACGAVLFAVHPLASEAVNMVSGRSEQLVVLFLLLGVRAHLAATGGRLWPLAASAVCCGLACGSKETGVVLPALLAVVEVLRRLRGETTIGAAVRRLAPTLAVVLFYLWVRRAVMGVATVQLPAWQGGVDLMIGGGRDLATQYSTMALLLPRTLAQMLVPIGLSLDPAVPFVREPWSAPVLCGGLLLVVLTWLGVRQPRRQPLRAFGTLLAWATAAPWILIPLNVPLAEHRLYGPLAGLALVTATAPALLRPRAAVAAVAAILALFAGLSAQRSLEYRDEAVLWQGVLASQPRSVRGLCGLATSRATAGRYAEARRLVAAALRVYPDHLPAQRNLAELNLELGADGDPFVAVVMAESLLEREPDNPFHLLLLGRAWAAAGDRTGNHVFYERAERAVLHCLEVAEPKALVYRTAADIRDRAGDPEGALDLLQRSIERGLDHHSVWLDRHRLLLRLGRRRQAEQALLQALHRAPFDPGVRDADRAFRAAPPK